MLFEVGAVKVKGLSPNVFTGRLNEPNTVFFLFITNDVLITPGVNPPEAVDSACVGDA